MMLIFFIIANFATQYRDFLNSPKSESIFVGLTRKDYQISDFSNDPIVLWYWRTNSGDPLVDSLLKKIPLERNFYLSAILRWEANEANTYETILNKLNLAIHFDSLALENFLSLIVLVIKYRKFNLFSKIFMLPILAEFQNQVFIITNLIILFSLVIFIVGFIFILVKVVYYLPVLSHRIDPQKHNQIKGIIPFLILLVPILVFRHPFLIFIIYAILLVLVFSPREKNWLRLNIIALLLISLFSFPLNYFIPFLKGTDKNYRLYELVAYDTEARINPETIKEKEILAYALKQQGAMDEALSLYEELYYEGNRDIAVVNNLANLYFIYDEDAKAETLYHQLFNYGHGEPYFNLGLLKLKNIEYLQASEYMEQARKKGFSSLSKEPVDIKPGNEDFYKIILAKGFELPQFINPIYLLPFLIILIFSFLPLTFSRPFYCKICGQAMCRDCLEKIGEEEVCKECSTKLKSTKNAEIEDDLRNSLGRNRKFLYKFLSYAVNIIIPGAGLIYQGKNFTGLAILFFVMIGYVPLLFANCFIKPAGWIALPFGAVCYVIGVVIAFFSYILSFILMKGSYAD